MGLSENRHCIGGTNISCYRERFQSSRIHRLIYITDSSFPYATLFRPQENRYQKSSIRNRLSQNYTAIKTCIFLGGTSSCVTLYDTCLCCIYKTLKTSVSEFIISGDRTSTRIIVSSVTACYLVVL